MRFKISVGTFIAYLLFILSFTLAMSVYHHWRPSWTKAKLVYQGF